MEIQDDNGIVVEKRKRKRKILTEKMKEEKAYRRKLYNRESQRQYRQHILNETKNLKNEIEILQNKLNNNLLSWKDISLGIFESIEEISYSNNYLNKKIILYFNLIQNIIPWIKTFHLSKNYIKNQPCWRHVTLLGHATSRKLGFDWITKQLYHNTNFMYQKFQFPSLSTREYIGDFHLEYSKEEMYQYSWRVQQELQLPFDKAVENVQQNVLCYLLGATWSREWSGVNVLASEPLDTSLLGEIGCKIGYGRTRRSSVEDVNFLCREFSSDGKITIVAQHIHEDENYPSSLIQCNRMFWVTVDRITDEISTLRVLFLSSHYFKKDGYVSFDMECFHHWGLDLSSLSSEQEKRKCFQNHINRAGNEFVGALNPLLKMKK